MAKALLFNIPESKLSKIRFALFKLGIEPRVVKAEEFSLPIGYLAGTVDAAETGAPAEPFEDEMLVMCSFRNAQVDGLLEALRKNRVPVSLKAVLTETNSGWNACRLHVELCAERDALRGARLKEAGEKSRH